MPGTQLTNPAGVFGETATRGVSGYSLISVTTAAIPKNMAVCLSTATAGSMRIGAALADPLVVGITDSIAAIAGQAYVVTEGFHLVAVSTDALPTAGDFLSISTSTVTHAGGAVKTSTATVALGTVIAVALSSVPDASGSFIPAYIHKL